MKNKSREELKKLQSMKTSIEVEIKDLEMKSKNLSGEIRLKKASLNNINQRIINLTKNSSEITISEHAILRYLQRVEEVDLEEIEKKILPEDVKEMIQSLGNGNYPVNNKFKIVVNNNVVTTVIKND